MAMPTAIMTLSKNECTEGCTAALREQCFDLTQAIPDHS